MANITDNFNHLKNKLIFKKYKLTKLIGKGSFGCVFKGNNIIDNTEVAVKLERKNYKVHLLEIESNFLTILKGYGIPEIKGFGYCGNYYVLIQELLGLNLMQIKYLKNFRYSLKDISMLAIQIIDRIEYVHSKLLLHRDIKPENFVVGYKNNSIIYIIDFGISRKYKSSHTGKHLKYSLTGRMFGTVRYASYNASRGVEQSRRDDLESIGYMLIFLATGYLPWKGISLKDKNMQKKYREMLLLKKYTPSKDLCRNLPPQFADYIDYCKKLSFEQDPDYEYLRSLFIDVLEDYNRFNDMKFSWIPIMSNKIPRRSSKNSKDLELNKNASKDKDKYVNLLKRKDTPQKRLFKAIQKSLEKDEKKYKLREVPKSEVFVEQKNLIFDKKYNDIIESNKNSKQDEIDYSNINDSKDALSYNSVVAQYNMDVTGFEDENKLIELNNSIINSMRSRKNSQFSSQKNSNSLNFTDYYFQNEHELKSYNYNSKNIIKSNLNNELKSSKKIPKLKPIKRKLNISLDLSKNFCMHSNLSEEGKNKLYNSEIIKENTCSFIDLTKMEKKRQSKIGYMYMNVLNKIKKNLDSFIKKNYKYSILFERKKNNALSYDNINKYKENDKNLNYKKNYTILNGNDFTFQNYAGFNNLKTGQIVSTINSNKNDLKKYHIRKIPNNYIPKNEKNQNYKKIYINNSIKRAKVNSENFNFNLSQFLENQKISDTDKNINIIINNNINSINRPSIGKNQNFKLYSHQITHSESDNMINFSKISEKMKMKNKLYEDRFKNNNFLYNNQKSSKSINDNGTLLQNKAKPILQNYIDSYKINTVNAASSGGDTSYTIDLNNNSKLNNTQRISHKSIILSKNNPNNIQGIGYSPNKKQIRIMQYKPLYNISKYNIIKNNNKITTSLSTRERIKNIVTDSSKSNFVNRGSRYHITNILNDNSLYLKQKRDNMLSLNIKDQNKTSHILCLHKSNSPTNNIKINVNKYKIPKGNHLMNNYSSNSILNNNNNNIFNDLGSYNLKQNMPKLENPPNISYNHRIYLRIGRKKIQPSLRSVNSSDNINNATDFRKYEASKRLINNRSNSNKTRECFNTRFDYMKNFDNYNAFPKNINFLNATMKNNNAIPRCFNNCS